MGVQNPSFICYYSEIYFLHWHEESGIPIRENIFRAEGWSRDYACSVRWRCHLQPALFSAFYCRRCSDRKPGTRWLWTPTDTPRKVGPFRIFNPHLALVHHILAWPKVMAIEIFIQCLVLEGDHYGGTSHCVVRDDARVERCSAIVYCHLLG